jgi:alkylation response protein AidB-like acyl-CoA dehydrogenase
MNKDLVKRMITNMVVSIEAGTALCQRVGRLRDEGSKDAIMAAWIAKYYTTTAATPIAADAIQLHGARGALPEYEVERYYRDVKMLEIIEGSTQLQETVIADLAYRRGRNR